MQADITKSSLPVLTVTLQNGESIISEAGDLSWKTPNVAVKTVVSAAGTGILGALGRSMVGGVSFSMNEYRVEKGVGKVSFTAKIPGAILEEHLLPGKRLFIHKNGFKAATPQIKLTASFQGSIAAGFFGGNGFFMQKVEGHGRFWVELGGDVVVMQLAAGEQLEVHPGHVGMFEESVGFDITTVPGITNKLFGGNGMFLVKLTGPGKIWLQTLTLSNLAYSLKPFLEKSS